MSIYYSIDKIRKPFRNAAVTIGNFDGVHTGHQKLFAHLKETAREIDGESVVITFYPHPLRVLTGSRLTVPRMINPLEQRLELIGCCGVDHIVVIPFTRAFSHVRAEEFVRDILCRRMGMKAIVIGHDYAFGYRREGNIDLLRRLGRELGFDVRLQTAVLQEGERVSSTLIRKLIVEGEVERVYVFLGRYYQLDGKVVPGRKVGGSVLGFPTANLDPVDELLPAQGVYVVEADVEGDAHHGVCNVGFNPTFGLERLSVEVHLLDFEGNIYGRSMRVHFLRRLREERKFSRVEDLVRQISKDVEEARRYFRERSPQALKTGKGGCRTR